jgi:hypothetical protein
MINIIKKWVKNTINKKHISNRLNNKLLYTDNFGVYNKDEINGVSCKKYVILYMKLTGKSEDL